ncbi:uncharacterized protein [Argopecten irradians]|uniref:uncharacterized protein n=1 Tax=Argopecten irradians TaxID=31199 RepID=UPI00371DCC22
MNLNEDLPLQNSLGLVWDLNTDKFVYKVSLEDKPATRRGILSTINGLYDPLGFVAPYVIKGKVILRNLLRHNPDWDEPLPEEALTEWNDWKRALCDLNDVSVPRCYVASGLSSLREKKVKVFCDASEVTIAASAYLEGIDENGSTQSGFWHFIPTHLNPADQGTRFVAAKSLQNSAWLNGHNNEDEEDMNIDCTLYPLIQPDEDKEVRAEVCVRKTQITDDSKFKTLEQYFEKFSSFKRLVNAFKVLRNFVRKSKVTEVCQQEVDMYKDTQTFILKVVQEEHYSNELECFRTGHPFDKNSSIRNLNPYIDNDGLLRVEGRLINSGEGVNMKNPVIIPGKSYVVEKLRRKLEIQRMADLPADRVTIRSVLNGIMLEHGNKELTHEVLVTFFAEVAAIVNSRPLVPVSSDSEQPFVLSPNMLLTQKTDSCVTSFDFGEFDTKDMYKAQWKRVQYLADIFWSRWKKEYLCSLQQRRKWIDSTPNLQENDVVLLRKKDLHRNSWPMGIIVDAIKSKDGIVRNVQVRVCRDRKRCVYTRPIREVVLLVKGQ